MVDEGGSSYQWRFDFTPRFGSVRYETHDTWRRGLMRGKGLCLNNTRESKTLQYGTDDTDRVNHFYDIQQTFLCVSPVSIWIEINIEPFLTTGLAQEPTHPSVH